MSCGSFCPMQGGNFLKKSLQKSKNLSTFYKKVPKNPKRVTLRKKKGGNFLTHRKKKAQKGGGCACEAVSKFPHSIGGKRTRSKRNQKNA